MGNNNNREKSLLAKVRARQYAVLKASQTEPDEILDASIDPNEWFFDEKTGDFYATKPESSTGEKHMVQLYDPTLFKQALDKLEDDRDPRHELYTNILKTDPKRSLARVTEEKLRDLEGLKRKFPNFKQVIGHIKDLLELEYYGQNRIIKHPPILLDGPPGIGKTRLINEVANVLDVGHVRVIDVASTSNGFVIGGNSTKWKDGGQGEVTKALQHNTNANPIIVLDEIDKASKGDYQVLGSLYSLLEQHTASKFIDEALELPMNCAHIIMFATANNLNDVPSAIQSRFDIYHVNMPSKEQMRAVVYSVFGELLSENDWGLSFNLSLSESVMTLLQQRTPRDLKKTLWKACAKALQRDKCSIGKRDDLISLMPVDFEENYSPKPTRPIGFY